jgi:hypothetical protein
MSKKKLEKRAAELHAFRVLCCYFRKHFGMSYFGVEDIPSDEVEGMIYRAWLRGYKQGRTDCGY